MDCWTRSCILFKSVFCPLGAVEVRGVVLRRAFLCGGAEDGAALAWTTWSL